MGEGILPAAQECDLGVGRRQRVIRPEGKQLGDSVFVELGIGEGLRGKTDCRQTVPHGRWHKRCAEPAAKGHFSDRHGSRSGEYHQLIMRTCRHQHGTGKSGFHRGHVGNRLPALGQIIPERFGTDRGENPENHHEYHTPAVMHQRQRQQYAQRADSLHGGGQLRVRLSEIRRGTFHKIFRHLCFHHLNDTFLQGRLFFPRQ